MTRWWWRWRQWWWKWSGQLLLGSNPRPTHEQPAVACRQCLSRALLRQEVTTSVAQGGVEVLASVVVAIGLEVYDAVAASRGPGRRQGWRRLHGSGSLGGLPRRCHVPQCMPIVHEGQGEVKDGDGGTHLITDACSNMHHAVNQESSFRLQRQPLYSGRRNAITSCLSICIRSPLAPCTLSANHLVHCRQG